MKADYLSHKRAAGVSLLGMALQGVMGLAVLIYGIVPQQDAAGHFVRDAAAQTGGLLILFGVPVWLVLAIVFDQHRRERIEALENESLAQSGARSTSAFAEGTDDFRVAHRRLMWMHKFLVPTASLAIAAVLAGVGVWRYAGARVILNNQDFVSSPNFGWPIAVGLFVAFFGFVFARYVAGMAKQPVWSALRAGAAASVGAALAGLALAASQFIDYVGPNTAIRWLHAVFPIVMFVLAGEVLLNFLLGIYRPRRAGDVPPPAFNSRLLGFAAAPDRIAESIGGALNYQFGFDVSGSWFYQLLSRWLVTLGVAGLAVMWAMTCLAVVQPNEQGVRVLLGSVVGDRALGAGPYLKFPWPFERIETFQTTAARRLNLGGEPPKIAKKSVLWTNDHGVAETFFAVQPSASERAAGEAEHDRASPSAIKDLALVAAEIPLVYEVTDLVRFERFGAPDQREEILRAIGRREVFLDMATQSVDRVLGEGRAEVSTDLRRRVQERFDALDAGVRVLFVGIEGVHPPREVAASFETIVQAGQKRETQLRSAEAEAHTMLIGVAGSVEAATELASAIRAHEALMSVPTDGTHKGDREKSLRDSQAGIEELLARAGGTAAMAIQQARADRWVRHMDAKSLSEGQAGNLAGFRQAPEAYVAQTYFQTLQSMLKDARVYIVADGVKVEVRTNLEEAEFSGNALLAKPKE